jgi:hypothetical protein
MRVLSAFITGSTLCVLHCGGSCNFLIRRWMYFATRSSFVEVTMFSSFPSKFLCSLISWVRQEAYTHAFPSENRAIRRTCISRSCSAACNKLLGARAESISEHRSPPLRTRLPIAPAAFARVLSSGSNKALTSNRTLGFRSAYLLVWKETDMARWWNEGTMYIYRTTDSIIHSCSRCDATQHNNDTSPFFLVFLFCFLS